MKKIFILSAVLILISLLMMISVMSITIWILPNYCNPPISPEKLTECAYQYCMKFATETLGKDITTAKAFCTGPTCGDGNIRGYEDCDGRNLGMNPVTGLPVKECADALVGGEEVYRRGMGTLGCYGNIPPPSTGFPSGKGPCMWNTDGCFPNRCGDGIKNSWIDTTGNVIKEQCDTTNYNMMTCNEFGTTGIFPSNQYVHCTRDCVVDMSDCILPPSNFMCCLYEGFLDKDNNAANNLWVKAIGNVCTYSLITGFSSSCPSYPVNIWYLGSDGNKYYSNSIGLGVQTCRPEKICLEQPLTPTSPPGPTSSHSSTYTSITNSNGNFAAGVNQFNIGQWITVEVIA